jgi:hypothetical protein
MRRSRVDFIRQQGFTTDGCHDGLYTALMFQPRVVGCVVALGVVLQDPWVFLALSLALWLGALVPAQNPFDAFFNHVIADRWRLETLPVAPEPRRFALGMVAAFAMAIGVALLAGAPRAAWLVEGLLAAAVMKVIFGRDCLGAALYHRLWPRTPARPCPPSMGHEPLRHEETVA